MAVTEFALNAPLAIQRWSKALAVHAAKAQYFAKFMGPGFENLIMVKDELNKGAGEKITFGVRAKLVHPGIEGDNLIEGHATGEEGLQFFNDSIFIDQLRKSTKSKGKMSEQRVPYNLRKEGRDALSVWWAEEMDEQIMVYLAGARGVNADFHQPTGWTGRANNAIQVPSSGRIIYGGNATGPADMDNADGMTLGLVERLVAKAETTDPMIQPFSVNGEKKFVLLMHTFQAFAMRTSTTENDWMDITKAAAGATGEKATYYKNSLGEYADVILHKHRNVIRFSDYGAGGPGTLPAARALFLGAQAGVIAYGQNSDTGRYNWHEESDDRGNALAITAGSIFGVKKIQYNSADFGLMAVDTYCAPVG